MNEKTMLSIAFLAVFMMLGSAVSAVDGSSSTGVGVPVLLDADAVKLEAKVYEKYKIKIESAKQAKQAKAEDSEKYFGTVLSGDDAVVMSVLADRLPAEKLKILQTLNAKDKANVLQKLKEKYQDSLVNAKESDERKSVLEARLLEIRDAQSTGDSSARIKARLALAKKICLEQNADNETICQDLLAVFERLAEKGVLTSDDITDAGLKLGQLRVVWVEKHYSKWLERALNLDSKLTRVETKLAALVERAKAADAESTTYLAGVQQKFTRIHNAYTDKLDAMTSAHTAFEADSSLRNALIVRARALELRAFGKFAVHAVNRFVYLYHGLIGDDASDGVPVISSVEAAAIVDAIPEPSEIEVEVEVEIEETLSTDDVPASELVVASAASESGDSGNDSPSDVDNDSSDDSEGDGSSVDSSDNSENEGSSGDGSSNSGGDSE